MNSELEFKIFYDETPKKPSENFRINEYFRQKIENNGCSFTGRIYKSNKGVILGNNQSLEDIDTDYCKKNGYEILRRKTNGGAIILDENSVISYSLFFRKSINNLTSTKDYYDVLITLSKKLNEALKGKNNSKNNGLEFKVSGEYYLNYVKNQGYSLIKKEIPFERHFLYEKDYLIQLDAYVNVKKPNLEEISKIIKLRELYSKNGDKLIIAGNHVYDIKGNSLLLTPEEVRIDYRLKRKEGEKLEEMEGLEELGIKDEFFMVLFETLKEKFSAEIIELKDNNNYFHPDISANISSFEEENNLMIPNLGHAFVDLLGQEQKFKRNRKNHKIFLKK